MQTYTYEEAYQASLNYFGGDELAYIIGWCIMKTLVPKYKPIVVS